MGRHREGPVFLPTSLWWWNVKRTRTIMSQSMPFSIANIRAAPIVNTKHENRIQLWEYLTQTFAPIVSILIQFYMTLEFVYGIVKMSSYRRYVCLMLYFAYISCHIMPFLHFIGDICVEKLELLVDIILTVWRGKPICTHWTKLKSATFLQLWWSSDFRQVAMIYLSSRLF